ncbi:hypothetical protein [Deinococcus soli (ex Cha et al. 2016)]|uniref:Uncharacterized protein n=2 Tax=Deinococcus soli (ex Cha et al. 2016) TaxID=1309411 RepID=A0ACC6KJU8_9DEIO|nr:hypothetical protein [Deinococcus soli (ex Cha et al. 2016)]MDR6219817.1 hypothetical protein [Deinococcus soli (ex Cha et al. 2016)]MDR6329925.1 hypothetical protein [Deinococcus soli (ex Cha et al. 2016)]MDR6752724.1 hypothetical protein [Deinococcus soli (ex Cha et al. 2016)]
MTHPTDRHTDDFDDLDTLLAQARQLTPADLSAADRFLTRRRAARSRSRAGWLTGALASAALVAGLTVLRPAAPLPGPLPSSAAYDAYQSTWGADW